MKIELINHPHRQYGFSMSIILGWLGIVSAVGLPIYANSDSPAISPPSSGGVVLYVSKLGDNSDGSSWLKAFTTIQAALDAIPNEKGGHCLRIRPDTYMEANLAPAHKGAPGNYNRLEVDFDGRFGSGSRGYAVVDCSDPEKGFKSLDWWSNFKANPQFSGIGWDRWIIRYLYATGGDAGLFWDLPPKKESFTIVVEDSVGIGRAFGGGIGNFYSRPEEPNVFRRCRLWSLDWWGDAGGAYVRAEGLTMSEHPDVIFEDSILVGPDNALQAGNPGFAGCTRVKLKGCRLVSLNFSQPQGTPSSGVINSKIKGNLLHVDLEDCLLMGYKVFGAGEGDVEYTTQGWVEAYVQYQQEIPQGFHRLAHWPTQVFSSIVPPSPIIPQSNLVKESRIINNLCETAPVIWQDKLYRMECERPASGGDKADYYLQFRDDTSGELQARFADGYGLASTIVHGGTMYVFASRHDSDGRWNDVTLFMSSDLRQWSSKVVIQQEQEHLFNSSVCRAGDQFVMAYETDDSRYSPFSVKFAVSRDLQHWEKVGDAVFGKERYTACPCIRYAGGFYYLLYTEHRKPRWFFETYIARSRDLKNWELSQRNPVLTPDWDEGINASDPDILEYQGKTYLYYTISDQLTWAKTKRAVFPGSLQTFFECYF